MVHLLYMVQGLYKGFVLALLYMVQGLYKGFMVHLLYMVQGLYMAGDVFPWKHRGMHSD